jgi:Spy/CpxP family protein refolding chaperone
MLRIAVIGLLACRLINAQAPHAYFPWWDRPLAKNLNLTPSQQQKIRTTVREFRNKLAEERAAMQRAELDLQDVFNDDTIDVQRAFASVENLALARENLTRTFAQMALRLRLVLTKDQWQQLQKRRQEETPPEKSAPNPRARP